MAHILVIDDQDTVRLALSSCLQLLGHDVRTAADGEEGLALFAEDPADLVITDVQMPRKDGFAVLSTLRREHPEVPVIVMSGVREESCSRFLDLISRYKSSHVTVLRKPFALLEVEQAVEAALPARPPSWINVDGLRRLFATQLA
jgi:CheY-like chemotaxis protein